MKKMFYLVFFFLCITFSVFAQGTIVLADYEPGSSYPDRTSAWNGANLTTGFANPLKAGINTSDGVAEFHITSQWSDAVTMNNFDESISLALHPIVKLKVLSASQVGKSINMQVTDINGFSQNISQTLSGTVNSAWEEVTFDFSNIAKTTSISFIKDLTIKIDYGNAPPSPDTDNKYYLDDISFNGPAISMSESDIMTLYSESFSGNPWWGTAAENTLDFFRTAQWGGSALTAAAKFYNGSDLLRMAMVDWSIAVAEFYPGSVNPAYSHLEIKDIDISGLGNFTLRYNLRWNDTPTSFSEAPTIQYSVDGGSWATVTTSSSLPGATGVWTALDYNLSSVTGSVLKLRISNNTSANFLIDEIVLKGHPVFVSGITVSTPGNVSKILTKNGTLQMLATVLPATANQKVLWTVIPGTGSATINSTNGFFTAVSNGTVQVKARALDVWGSVSGTKEITISAVDSINFTAETYEVTTYGTTVNTQVAFYPADVTQNLTYTSGNTGVASIDGSGVITPVSNGNTWLYATTEGGLKKDSLYMVVNFPLDSIDFTADAYEITTIDGDEVNTHVDFYPTYATKNIIYTSGDNGIATISASGVIQAISNGEVWLYAESEDGIRKDSINLVVNIPAGSINFTADTYEITSISAAVNTNVDFFPSTAVKSVIYTTGNPGIATIDESGVISPVINGNVWLYAESEDGSGKDSINMIVNIPTISIDFTADAYEITAVDMTINTHVAFTPSFAPQAITYTTGNPGFATIDESGVISPVSNGEVWLYAETADGNLKDSINLVVNIPTEAIEFTADVPEITSLDEVATHVTFFPGMATQNIIYTSGNPYVATINGSGMITPVSNGKVRLYAETADGNLTDFIDIVVNIPIYSIDFLTTDYDITSFDEKIFTTVKFNPGFTFTKVLYTSSNPEVAAIDEFGVISPVSNGEAWLKATTEDGILYDRFNVQVAIPADSIDFTAQTNEITTVGGKLKTHVAFYPNGATQQIVYESGNPAIATIDDSGVIKAVTNGESWLYATIKDGIITDSTKIVVNIPADLLLLADYEPNSLLPDRTSAWNNSDLNKTFENPLKAGINISDGVAAFHITSQYSDAVVLNNFDESISLAQHPFVKLKILSDSAVAKTINLEVIDINGFSQNINRTLSKDVNSKWELVTFDFSEIVKNSPISFINSIIIKVDYGTVASGSNSHNKYYLDDILFCGPAVDLTESDILTLFSESFSGNPWWMTMPREKTIADFRTASWGGSALTANAKYYNATDSLKMEMVDWSIGVPEFYPSSVRPTLSSLLIKNINISGYNNFALKYNLRWKSTPADLTKIPTLEYSVDGSDWTTLETTSDLPSGAGVWKTLSYQISSVTGSLLKLRITNNASANLFVDEIIITGNPSFVSNLTVSTEGDIYKITKPQGTLQMLANVLPADANQNVLWSVIPETGDATINANGLLKAVSDGTVLVKARALDANGTISATREITISNQTDAVESMDFTADVSEINSLAGKINTQVTFSSGANGQLVIYTSNNPGIATINESGVISPVTNGEVWLFAELEDGSLKDSLSILVNIPVESIDFTADVYEIKSLKEKVNTHVAFTPVFTSQNVIYTSGNSGIATISATGVISPVANGEVWIYAETADGNHTDSLSIVVNATITDVNLAGQEVNCKIYPNPATEYVSISSSLQIKTVRIYNTASQLVRIVEVNSVSKMLNVNELHSGVYMLLIETERGSLVKKLVKK